MAWIDEEHGWVAAPEDIMNALSSEGFEECKREMTTSRQDRRPACGRASTHDGIRGSMIWANRPTSPDAIVFMAINGESLTRAGAPRRGSIQGGRGVRPNAVGLVRRRAVRQPTFRQSGQPDDA